MFPAESEDQNAIIRLRKIPKVPFISNTIPTNPKINIGNKEYPSVLITLYRGIMSDFKVRTKSYLVHEIYQKVHDGVSKQKHRINVTEMNFS